MSLHVAAQHLASKGRNGDTTLVHMTKREVAGLQALAQHHGKTMTINPHTGLPEAFSLKSLLPMAIGAGLAFATGGTSLAASGGLFGLGMPATIGAGVGAFETARTGSLKQGLMAGLGAYGGAGLAGMAGAGAAGASSGAAGSGTTAAATPAAATPVAPTAANSAITPGVDGVVTAPAVNTGAVTGSAMDAATAGPYGGPATPSMWETFSKNVAADPTAAAKAAGYSAVPAIAAELEPKPIPEIKQDTDMGQRYIYDSGYDNSLPGRTGQPAYTKVSNEEAKKYYGFADGGEIQYPTGESVIRMATGGAAPAQASLSGYGAYTPADANVAAYGLGTGIDYSGYDTAPNAGIAALAPQASAMPGANPNQNIVDLYKEVDAKQAADKKTAAEKKAAEEAEALAASNNPGVFAAGGLMQSYAQGGISTLGGYSDGGRLLKGPGDGMSDNIPAQIGRKQPARLADGEFVVPADVVSHLGNGSTDAGAKQLYKMMDKIRAARTGRKTQGKQINPNKYIPA
jgi:hypothetical protein